MGRGLTGEVIRHILHSVSIDRGQAQQGPEPDWGGRAGKQGQDRLTTPPWTADNSWPHVAIILPRHGVGAAALAQPERPGIVPYKPVRGPQEGML